MQSGYGLGGLFRGLYRSVSPSLKKGLAAVGKRALKAGADILEDVVVNKTPIKQAVKKRAKSEMQTIKNQIKGSQQKPINRSTLNSNQVIKPKKKKQTRRKKNSSRWISTNYIMNPSLGYNDSPCTLSSLDVFDNYPRQEEIVHKYPLPF